MEKIYIIIYNYYILRDFRDEHIEPSNNTKLGEKNNDSITRRLFKNNIYINIT